MFFAEKARREKLKADKEKLKADKILKPMNLGPTQSKRPRPVKKFDVAKIKKNLKGAVRRVKIACKKRIRAKCAK